MLDLRGEERRLRRRGRPPGPGGGWAPRVWSGDAPGV